MINKRINFNDLNEAKRSEIFEEVRDYINRDMGEDKLESIAKEEEVTIEDILLLLTEGEINECFRGEITI